MKLAALITQPRGGPVDHAVDVLCALASRGHETVLIGPPGGYAERLSSSGVQFYELAIETKTDIRGLRALGRLLAEVRPDVLHCQDMRAGMFGRLAARRRHLPVVYTVHGVQDGLAHLVAGNAPVAAPRRRDALYYLTLERLLAKTTHARFVVVAAVVRDYLVEHVRIPAGAIDVVHNGVDTARFRPVPKPDRDGVTALWLGLMGPVKRVANLLDALVEVPGLRLLLAGDGPLRAELGERAHRLGLADRVVFLGHVDDPATAFGQADFFVLPSAAEALPLSLLQAMASGLPVIATRVGGVPEIVRPGSDGLLVAPDDVAALTAALRELTADPGRRGRMAANARERATSEFSLAHCVDQLLEVYQRAGRG